MVAHRYTGAEEQLHGICSQRQGHEHLGCADLMLAFVMCAVVQQWLHVPHHSGWDNAVHGGNYMAQMPGLHILAEGKLATL